MPFQLDEESIIMVLLLLDVENGLWYRGRRDLFIYTVKLSQGAPLSLLHGKLRDISRLGGVLSFCEYGRNVG